MKKVVKGIGFILGIVTILVAVFLIVTFVVSFYKNKKLEKQRKQYEERVIEDVKKGIEEKYGFTPEISKVVTDTRNNNTGFFENHNSFTKKVWMYEKAYLECSDGTRTFYTLIDLNDNSLIDNYQEEEIITALQSYFEKSLGIPIIAFRTNYGKEANNIGLGYDLEGKHLIETKFDGSNYIDILTDYMHKNYNPTEIVEIVTICDTIKDISYDKLTEVFGDTEFVVIMNMQDKNTLDSLVDNDYEYYDFQSKNENCDISYAKGVREFIRYGTQGIPCYENVVTGEEICFNN